MELVTGNLSQINHINRNISAFLVTVHRSNQSYCVAYRQRITKLDELAAASPYPADVLGQSQLGAVPSILQCVARGLNLALLVHNANLSNIQDALPSSSSVIMLILLRRLSSAR
jgi:hypothetical protein